MQFNIPLTRKQFCCSLFASLVLIFPKLKKTSSHCLDGILLVLK